MGRVAAVPMLASLLLLTSCSDDGPPTDLPLVVTETSQQGTVQVTVDPEGSVLTSRNGTTTREDFGDEELDELREHLAEADLESLDGHFVRDFRYIILAGDVEIYLGAKDVPERLVPMLEWIEEHRG